MKDNRELDYFHHHFTLCTPSNLLHNICINIMFPSLILIIFTFFASHDSSSKFCLWPTCWEKLPPYLANIQYPRHTLNLSANSTLNNMQIVIYTQVQLDPKEFNSHESHNFLILPYDHFLGEGEKPWWEWESLMKEKMCSIWIENIVGTIATRNWRCGRVHCGG